MINDFIPVERKPYSLMVVTPSGITISVKLAVPWKALLWTISTESGMVKLVPTLAGGYL